MYAAIVSSALFDQAYRAIKKMGDIVFEQDEEMDSTTTRNTFQSVSRVMANTVIVDLDAGPGVDIVQGLKHYRTHRPRTRIIILAPDRKPGDPVLSKIVNLGIYDIVSGSSDADWTSLLFQSLNGEPATYADAIRWHTVGDEEGQGQKERVVYETKPAGMVSIAVAGTAPGIGVTHTSLSIASYLASKKYTVAIVEACPRPGLGPMCAIMEAREGKVGDSWRVSNLDIFPVFNVKRNTLNEPEPDIFHIIREKLYQLRGRYEYMILDLGEPNSTTWEEILRAQIGIMVASASPWRWTDLQMYTGQLQNNESIHLLVNQPSDKHSKMLRRDIGISFFSLPFTPNPFSPAESEEVLGNLLAPVLPGRKEKKSVLNFLNIRK